MCVDYRGLNVITAKDRYHLPYIEDLLNKLHGARVFTKLDLASGYHQVPVHSDDCHKTAFIALDGFYKYKVIPLDLQMRQLLSCVLCTRYYIHSAETQSYTSTTCSSFHKR